MKTEQQGKCETPNECNTKKCYSKIVQMKKVQNGKCTRQKSTKEVEHEVSAT